MQLITRCPQCRTAFAFDAAQIRVAQGWVRCGKCATLFESDKHLFERKESIHPLSPRYEIDLGTKGPRAESQTIESAEKGDSKSKDPAKLEESSDEIVKLRSDLEALHDSLDETNTSAYKAYQNINNTIKSAKGNDASNTMQSLSDGLQDFQPFKSEQKQSNDEHESLNTTGLLKQANSSAITRVSYVIVVTFLVFLSVGQVLWIYREIIGAISAESHFFVKSICEIFDVELGWPKEPESLRIESSSFKVSEGGNYRLKLRLKNHQDYAVMTPLFELTLLGSEESVLVRKIIKPEDLDLQKALAADKDLSIAFNLAIDPKITDQIVGYKIDYFYQ